MYFEIKDTNQTTPCSTVHASPYSTFSFKRTEYLDQTLTNMLNISSTAFGVRVGLASVIVVGLHLLQSLSDFLTLVRDSPTLEKQNEVT